METEGLLEFEEKPIKAKVIRFLPVSYIVRRRLLIELIEKSAEEERHDFVKDILIRYKDVKKIYAYPIKEYWSNISSVDSYFRTNMDFLNKETRDYFFRQYPDVYSKVEDLPPAKYNTGSSVKNSLVSSGCIINGKVEDSILFKKVFIYLYRELYRGKQRYNPCEYKVHWRRWSD